MIFVDTSALYALADQSDINHKKAKEIFNALIGDNTSLLLHNYIIVESSALIQHRLGFSASEKFLRDVVRFYIIWIDSSLHRNGFEYYIKQGKRKLSFVDCMSFAVMHERHIETAFAFDADFIKAGFKIL